MKTQFPSPAILGGSPSFSEPLAIIRPTLPDVNCIFKEYDEILQSGTITNGKYLALLEAGCADYLQVDQAVAVSSCTLGLVLVFKALQLSGEVLVPSFTFPATVHALIWNQLTPVFVDCEDQYFNISIGDVTRKITNKTSAILAVYNYGTPPRISDLERIAKEHQLKLVFDAAQAFGAEYQGKKAGRFGIAEVFSFSPTKVLTSGEGGLVATNDRVLADKLRQLRNYGLSSDLDGAQVGLNARMSEFHAVIGLKNLETIENCIRLRNKLRRRYQEQLQYIEGLSFQQILPASRGSGNYMDLFVDATTFGLTRDELHLALRRENIETKKYFYPPVHQLQAYWHCQDSINDLVVTKKASNAALALPLYAHMSEEDVVKVCWAIERVYHYRDEMKAVLRPSSKLS